MARRIQKIISGNKVGMYMYFWIWRRDAPSIEAASQDSGTILVNPNVNIRTESPIFFHKNKSNKPPILPDEKIGFHISMVETDGITEGINNSNKNFFDLESESIAIK